MNVFLRASIVAALAAGAIMAWSPAAHASSPMGVFARVDSVSYEPDKANATKVQIHGAFALHQGGEGFNYSAPAAGYMYFACPAGKEAECREQWTDIEGYVGNKQACAGWGQQQKGFGTVHPEGTTAQAEPYELGLGVQGASFAGGTCPKLLSFSGTSSGGSSGSSGGGAGTSGGTTSGGTTNPPTGGGGGGGGETTPPSNPSPPPAPSSSTSSCAATPGTAGSAIAFAALVGAVIGFLARKKRGEDK